jgi:energy-coupling factor transporter transmembrane protein EcfT
MMVSAMNARSKESFSTNLVDVLRGKNPKRNVAMGVASILLTIFLMIIFVSITTHRIFDGDTDYSGKGFFGKVMFHIRKFFHCGEINNEGEREKFTMESLDRHKILSFCLVAVIITLASLLIALKNRPTAAMIFIISILVLMFVFVAYGSYATHTCMKIKEVKFTNVENTEVDKPNLPEIPNV